MHLRELTEQKPQICFNKYQVPGRTQAKEDADRDTPVGLEGKNQGFADGLCLVQAVKVEL